MIRIDNLQTYGFESAMRGMRNPMNSWYKNDTHENVVGENDLKLLQQLTRAGSDHRKALRQMIISFDVTAPLYWFKEFDQYKIGVTTNSTSTMHKLCSRPLAFDDFSFDDDDWMTKAIIDNLNARIKDYNDGMKQNKALWRSIIQLLPSAYNQTRTITMNYEVMMNIYRQRKHHKLREWNEFCAYMYDNLVLFKDLQDAVNML